MKISHRLEKLRQKLTEKEVDGILISQPENRYYLSGFSGSWGFLLVSPKEAILATDFRYIEQAKIQAPGYEVFRITTDISDLSPKITDLNLSRLGFEAGHMTFSFYHKLSNLFKEKQAPLKLIPLEGLVESLRAVKEPEELELITRAAEIGDKAFAYIETKIQPGMTEKEIAWEIEKFIREYGSQAVPFEIIVASGPNAALPHARPSDRVINPGEPVLMDIGAKLNGYASNLTRTICLGTPDTTFKKVYDIVLGAQLTAIAIIKEGMTGKQADSFARTVIEQSGYAEAFGHGLGHGVGLAVHESPGLGLTSNDVLTSGMVFTIEPGIYLPGWGGVRIEDLVVLEKDKVKVLSRARKV